MQRLRRKQWKRKQLPGRKRKKRPWPARQLSEGSLDNAEPPLAGKETAEIATEEAEAENSAEVIEEAESAAGAEAEEATEQVESEIEEERPDKEDGA